jgi:diguanylate cyclase (GGDEF)-like protein
MTLVARGLVVCSAVVCYLFWQRSANATEEVRTLSAARTCLEKLDLRTNNETTHIRFAAELQTFHADVVAVLSDSQKEIWDDFWGDHMDRGAEPWAGSAETAVDDLRASFHSAQDDADVASTAAHELLLWVSGGTYALTGAMLFGAAVLRRREERETVHQEAVFAAAKKFEAISADSPDIVFVLGPDGQISFMSASGHSVFGDELPKTSVDIVKCMPDVSFAQAQRWLSSAADAHTSEPVAVLTHIAERRLFDLRVADRRSDPLIRGRVFTCRDVTSEMLLQKRLRTRAATDDLTGLPNRRELSTRMHENWGAESAALVMIDLDDFKRTNDTLGHAAGDLLLVLVSQRFERVIGSRHTLVRLGGDEFAVWVTGEDASDCAHRLAEDLVDSLSRPIDLAGRNVRVGASIGVCCSAGCADPTELMRRADIAMYEAKALVGSSVIGFEREMEERVRRADAINRALQMANVAQDFHLVYQPIFEAEGSRPQIVEALLRWDHEELGFVPPDHFIPQAENSGAIVRIGCWVLWESLRQLKSWEAEGMADDIAIAVNVSYVQLEESGFVDDVLTALASTGVPGHRLVLEITETVMALDNENVARVLSKLQSHGVRIAIDDFGTGYSSLGQLLRLPFDLLKLDRSFLLSLDGADREAAGRAVIEATVRMGEACGVPLVAEGIEEIEQLDLLVSCGVQYAQGYLLARPGSPEAVLPLLLGQVSQPAVA